MLVSIPRLCPPSTLQGGGHFPLFDRPAWGGGAGFDRKIEERKVVVVVVGGGGMSPDPLPPFMAPQLKSPRVLFGLLVFCVCTPYSGAPEVPRGGGTPGPYKGGEWYHSHDAPPLLYLPCGFFYGGEALNPVSPPAVPPPFF